MMQPLLSICIPTYNRSDLIRFSLESIVNQIIQDDFQNIVEIVVVNNASSDDTETFIEEYIENNQGLNIRLINRKENIGADNVFYATEYLTGELVLIFSDDDILLPGTIEKIVGIKECHPNLDVISFNMKSFVDHHSENSDLILKQNDEIQIITSDKNMFLERVSTMITFLSSIIYRRSLVNTNAYAFAENKNLIQSFAFLDAINSGVLFVISNHTAYALRSAHENAMAAESVGHQYNFFQVMVYNFKELMEYALYLGFDPPLINGVLNKQLKEIIIPRIRFLRSLPESKNMTALYKKGMNQIFATYPRNIYTWTIIVPLLLSPRIILNIIRRTKNMLQWKKL